MKKWFCQKRLAYHAHKHGAQLHLAGDVAYAGLEFGLKQGAIWQIGQGSQMGKDGTLSLAEGAKFQLGQQSQIGRRWFIKISDVMASAKIEIGQRCRVEDDVKLFAFGTGNINIADDCFIGWGSIIAALGKLSVGQGTAIAEYVSIRDHNHLPDAGPVHLSPMQVRPITIGEGVWIGAKATIVAGVSIGDGAVVGANAVVTKDVPAGVRVAGVPARPIR